MNRRSKQLAQLAWLLLADLIAIDAALSGGALRRGRVWIVRVLEQPHHRHDDNGALEKQIRPNVDVVEPEEPDGDQRTMKSGEFASACGIMPKKLMTDVDIPVAHRYSYLAAIPLLAVDVAVAVAGEIIEAVFIDRLVSLAIADAVALRGAGQRRWLRHLRAHRHCSSHAH
jgi:hypothetical protein